MREYIVERVIAVADYIIDSQSTVRGAAKKFDVSKSTVHKDLTERLRLIDKQRLRMVKRVLNLNLAERHIRGGLATKLKYMH
ncbi:MAG TPA: sporulation transcriptional regulator SpoIIID [Eubacteriales bacterium]|nr:sporulation transcriptional regulator SpoIIID [Clostridia bacterium]HRX14115.1 sporulation transcriptional regulator SpoIIID [Eubacteriales bacterium]